MRETASVCAFQRRDEKHMHVDVTQHTVISAQANNKSYFEHLPERIIFVVIVSTGLQVTVWPESLQSCEMLRSYHLVPLELILILILILILMPLTLCVW